MYSFIQIFNSNKVEKNKNKNKNENENENENENKNYDLHQDIWIRCMEQLRLDRILYEKKHKSSFTTNRMLKANQSGKKIVAIDNR